MHCVEGAPEDIDIALQILDIVTPRLNVGMYSETAREITQTDHLNKHLLKTFLERYNTTNKTPTNNKVEDDSKEFDN